MAFSITEFLTNIQYGGARPALFEVNIHGPGTLPLTGLNNLRFFCKAASLPPSTLGTVNVSYFGRTIKLAGERTYPDWTVTIINDEDFSLRSTFEDWVNKINEQVSNKRVAPVTASPGSYKAESTVTQYGKTGNKLANYTLSGMFPTTVSPIEVNWGTPDAIEEFTVNFAYDYWTPTSTTA